LNNDRIYRDGNKYDKKFGLVKDEAVFFLDIRDLGNITKKYLQGFFLHIVGNWHHITINKTTLYRIIRLEMFLFSYFLRMVPTLDPVSMQSIWKRGGGGCEITSRQCSEFKGTQA
jgi:hypothetical protein